MLLCYICNRFPPCIGASADKCYCTCCNAEENCWSSSNNIHWVHRHNWYMGAPRGRLTSVRSIFLSSYIVKNLILFYVIWLFLFTWFCWCCSLETTRHVSLITITLSKKELDTSSIGWVTTYAAHLEHITLFNWS